MIKLLYFIFSLDQTALTNSFDLITALRVSILEFSKHVSLNYFIQHSYTYVTGKWELLF